MQTEQWKLSATAKSKEPQSSLITRLSKTSRPSRLQPSRDISAHAPLIKRAPWGQVPIAPSYRRPKLKEMNLLKLMKFSLLLSTVLPVVLTVGCVNSHRD